MAYKIKDRFNYRGVEINDCGMFYLVDDEDLYEGYNDKSNVERDEESGFAVFKTLNDAHHYIDAFEHSYLVDFDVSLTVSARVSAVCEDEAERLADLDTGCYADSVVFSIIDGCIIDVTISDAGVYDISEQ